MENNLKFNSAICTSRFQSERLLALGLKIETADCYLFEYEKGKYKVIVEPWEDLIADEEYYLQYKDICFPAWSLHRLLSLIPKYIEFQVSPMYGRNYTLPIELQITCELDICYIELNREEFKGFYGTDIYDSAIRCIEWLIKEGYFNKEYLCES